MNFVIGDVHGEVTKLKALVDHVDSFGDRLSLIFVGDYIDKGEDSKDALGYLTSLVGRRSCHFLLGNHEYCWMNLNDVERDFQSYLLKYGGLNTVQSFGCKNVFAARDLILENYGEFFSSLKPFHQTDDFVITHSGIDPDDFQTPIEDIPLEKLLFNRYRFIANRGYYLDRYRVIFGHTGFFRPYIDDFKIGIDTAACFLKEQPLTAYCIEGDFFVNSNGEVQPCRIHYDYCPNIVRVKPWRSIMF